MTAPAVASAATSSATSSALVARGLRRRFGATLAVDDIDLDLGDHEVLCLVGPSGCGKSTVLRMLAGLVRPDGGTVRLGDRVLDDAHTNVAPEARRIGIVFQDHALFPNLSVADNVAFGLGGRGRGAAARARRARVMAMLDLVGLADHADRYPHELSGGERQRVALARALAPAPAVLLLDEPFASLDQNLRVQVRAEVLAILRASGTPAVVVTHDQREALAVGDRVMVLRGGRCEQVGTPREVFHHPVNRFVASFMGEADFVDGTVADGRVTSEVGAAAAAPGSPDGPVTLVLRPDDVEVGADPDGDAVVVDAEFQGSSVLFLVRLASGATVRCRTSHVSTLAVDERVRVSLAEHHQPVVLAAP